ncbi:response regulator transcription factor [Changchengzhania lutea]|uniref:response regulator transcription factor n=1 Tax=Changchengzhania lutea TaxID=2049305 RepID=UPI00115D860B|nr:response regulator transcription factor [Changchengzhania lutea]
MNLQNQSLKQIKILLVENDAEHTNTFLQLAEAQGWIVFTCHGSMDAIRWVKDNNIPDLMVIDKNALPLDGFQTHDYIQSELKISVPVLISCQINATAKKNNKKLLSFINKPFSEKSIVLIKSKLKELGQPTDIEDKDYSLDYLRDLSDGSEEFVLTSLNIFRDSVAVKLMEIKEALAINEFKTVREIAHNIKPSFEMLESTIGSDLCNDIVYKVAEEEISGLVEQLFQLFLTIDAQLQKDIPKFAEA